MSKNGNALEPLENLPVANEPRCNICKSSRRQTVDRLIASGYGYMAIAEDILLNDAEFKGKNIDALRKNVERHAKRHVQVKDRAMRQIIERRAVEAGILVDEVDGAITTGEALLDLMVKRATEMIADPDQRVKFADALEAVRLAKEFEKSTYAEQLEVMQRQVWAISQAVKELVDPALHTPIAERAKEIFTTPQLELEKVK
jgi:hypothetical protein